MRLLEAICGEKQVNHTTCLRVRCQRAGSASDPNTPNVGHQSCTISTMRLHLHRLRRSSGTKSPDLCTLADTDLGHFAARGLKFGTRWEETLRLVSSPTLALCDVRARYSQNVCFDNSAERGPDSEEAVQVHSGPVSRESGPGVCEAHHVS